MNARQLHADLMQKLKEEKNRAERFRIIYKMQDLQKEYFLPCWKCKEDFLSKHFVDELPKPEELICPRCKA